MNYPCKLVIYLGSGLQFWDSYLLVEVMQDAALTDPNHGQRIPREMFFQSSVTKKMFIEQPMALKAFSVILRSFQQINEK